MKELNIRPGLSDIDPERNVENPDMDYGGMSGFDPEKTMVFQELSIGLTQGYFNVNGKDNALRINEFETFSNGHIEPDSNNQGNISESIVSSFMGEILDQVHHSSADIVDQPDLVELACMHTISSRQPPMVSSSSSVAASSADAYLDNVCTWKVQKFSREVLVNQPFCIPSLILNQTVKFEKLIYSMLAEFPNRLHMVLQWVAN